jgi:hypothetical protein
LVIKNYLKIENNQKKIRKIVKSLGKIWKISRKSKIIKETQNKNLK